MKQMENKSQNIIPNKKNSVNSFEENKSNLSDKKKIYIVAKAISKPKTPTKNLINKKTNLNINENKNFNTLTNEANDKYEEIKRKYEKLSNANPNDIENVNFNNESAININEEEQNFKEQTLNYIVENLQSINDINTTLRPIKDNGVTINESLENEFPVIESYCVLENEINKK